MDINARALTMAGEEFCVNAARAFGILLNCLAPAGRGRSEYSITVSGLESPVNTQVRGTYPNWYASAQFDLGQYAIHALSRSFTLVDLPGISHLLVYAQQKPTMAQMSEQSQLLGKQYGLNDKDAYGVVWWRLNGSKLEIWPHVTVPAAGTSMLENACGSASIALALALGCDNLLEICQPCGEILEVGVKNGIALAGGRVSLLSRGIAWLEE